MPDAPVPMTGATPPQTRQPGGSQQPAAATDSGLPHGMAGTWDIWISSGIVHRTDGLRTEQLLIPGAAMNLLRIAADGSYQWGNQRSRLQEIAPWFAQPGQRYFAVRQNADNQYIARFDAHTDKLNLFFWDVGGLAASGTRK